MSRLLSHEALWNRMGFPSQGVGPIKTRLSAFSKVRRAGMLIGCNIGPNPGSLKGRDDVSEYLGIAAKELCELIRLLYDPADYFVVNLSSPNTAGLRGLLCDARLCDELLAPVRRALSETEERGLGGVRRPLLLKLPPEDADRVPWTRDSLESVVGPIVERGLCDGFVATNTSTSLSGQLAAGLGSEDLPGGVSGAPLRSLALTTVRMLRDLIGGDLLIMGCGGVMYPEHVLEFIDAGAQVVQVYSGMVYRGPGLISECALVP
jgi:dihydroorotate dehydrogenase